MHAKNTFTSNSFWKDYAIAQKRSATAPQKCLRFFTFKFGRLQTRENDIWLVARLRGNIVRD